MPSSADEFLTWILDYPSETEEDFRYPVQFLGAHDPSFYYRHDGRYYGPISKVEFAQEFPQFISAPPQEADLPSAFAGLSSPFGTLTDNAMDARLNALVRRLN